MQLLVMLRYLLVLALVRPGHHALASPSPWTRLTFAENDGTSPAVVAAIAMPPLPFRLGSGARGSEPSASSLAGHRMSHPAETERLKPGSNSKPRTIYKRVERMFMLANPIIIVCILIMMMPAGVPNLTSGSRDFTYRTPLRGPQKGRAPTASELT